MFGNRSIFTVAALLIPLLSLVAIADEDVLIIAPDDFMEELEPLRRFKEATGRRTILMSLSDVYKNFTGLDQPEKVKACIFGFQAAHHIKSVMLVGDCDKFPVRSCKAYNTEWGSMYIPSDLYYADIYDAQGNLDDWDGGNPPYGGNGIYGEMDFKGMASPCVLENLNLDCIDMYPDVAVARVPASTEAEVTTYVDKIIRYELGAPGNWFKKALWVVDGGAGAFGAPIKKDRLDGYLTPHGFTITKRYYDDWDHLTLDGRAAELNNIMNAGVGFVNYFGHGGSFSWQGWYSSTHMVNLTNQSKLPIVFAVSCGTARFFWDGCGCSGCGWPELYWTVDGAEWKWTDCGAPTTARPAPMPVQPAAYDRESLAEEFLVKRATGGIAYIGCTFKQEYGGEDIDKYFFEAYDVLPGPSTLGSMWNYALAEWMTAMDSGMGLCYYYAYPHMHKVMLFGDPSLVVGGAFTTSVSGPLADWWAISFFQGLERYRVVDNITVAPGTKLSAKAGASLLFESGKKITAMDASATLGFHVNGTPDAPVYLLAAGAQPSSNNMVRGVKVSGQLRLRQGGTVKLY